MSSLTTLTRTKNRPTRKRMTTLAAVPVALLGLASASARADRNPPSSPAARAARAEIQQMLGFVPEYLEAMPDNALPGAWAEIKTLQANDNTALPCKVKEIIGVAVASQLPSAALAYGHTQIAKLGGATAPEIADGVAVAALTRHWSTFFNGMQLDEVKFRGEIARLSGAIKKAMASGAAPRAPLALTDARSVYADLEQSFGFVPEFITKFPSDSVAAAWREERDVEMSPSALADKYKSLVGLAVAAQIPCRFCVIADTELAKLSGATDREISEAVAMSSLVRHTATMLTGLSVDEARFRKDMDRIARDGRNKMKKAQLERTRPGTKTATTVANSSSR